MQLPGGRSTIVEVEYERVKKKCFHCFRLSHEKLKCPIFKAQKSNGKDFADKGKGIAFTPVIHRQHHPDLVDKIMPLLAPTAPPGFPPKSLVAPDVFEEMQLYMNCSDPEERRIREFKMVKALRDLSSNPGAQSSYLRLEDHPKISGVQNKNLGRVFDYRHTQTENDNQKEKVVTDDDVRHKEVPIPTEPTTMLERQRMNLSLTKPTYDITTRQQAVTEGSGENLLLAAGGTFAMGRDDQSISEGSGRNRATKRSATSWKRMKQNSQGGRKASQSDQLGSAQDEGDNSAKRKAGEGLTGPLVILNGFYCSPVLTLTTWNGWALTTDLY
ncbi:Uncharacterized protein Rs2_06472 [Raphanus sativus]|nr:Uncharacterized protein Rs2_06472 [Raphanus sativus]